ncbi:MAG: hypothetical protein WBA89_17300 [Microcoleus sp.]|uniref:hypothetical protein n=1 Tax=Microcoleus sp. TaxID=44472 RepID=UPI003C77D04A
MLPDGSYRMSLTQTAGSVGKPARSTFDFLRSKVLKRLLSEAGGTFDFLAEDTVAAISTDAYAVEQFSVDLGGQLPSIKRDTAGDVGDYLNSTAMEKTFAGFGLWFHRSIHQGMLTTHIPHFLT